MDGMRWLTLLSSNFWRALFPRGRLILSVVSFMRGETLGDVSYGCGQEWNYAFWRPIGPVQLCLFFLAEKRRLADNGSSGTFLGTSLSFLKSNLLCPCSRASLPLHEMVSFMNMFLAVCGRE